MDGIHGAVPFGALAMHDIGRKLTHQSSSGADTARVEGAHPTRLGHQYRVIMNSPKERRRNTEWTSCAGNHMDLHVRNQRKALQQRLGSRSEARNRMFVIILLLAIVGCELNNLHQMGFRS